MKYKLIISNEFDKNTIRLNQVFQLLRYLRYGDYLNRHLMLIFV